MMCSRQWLIGPMSGRKGQIRGVRMRNWNRQTLEKEGGSEAEPFD